MSSDALSEESLVREGAGYDETFGSSDESEDFSPSSERETSAQSLDGEDEGYAEGNEEVGVDEVGKEGSKGDSGDDDDGEDGVDDGEDGVERTSVGPRDNRPFIIPTEWAVNKFLRSCASGTKSKSISQSVSLRRTKNVTREGQLTLVCMMPCSLLGLGFR